jgi:hypothetical protein
MDQPLLQSDALLAVFASMDEVAFTTPQTTTTTLAWMSEFGGKARSYLDLKFSLFKPHFERTDANVFCLCRDDI